MLTLTIRTDKPKAEIGLFDEDNRLAYETWQAHRQLAETIHTKMHDLLKSQKKELGDLKAIAVFKGPGSFTGLRIGISAANALADGLGLPIVGSTGDNWIDQATKRLQHRQNDQLVLPEYGAPVRTTQPKHWPALLTERILKAGIAASQE